jgi:hypothetical protein
MVLSSVGTMFVWFAWFGLVPGNTWLMTTSYYVGSKAAVSVALAGSASGLSALSIMMARRSHLEMQVSNIQIHPAVCLIVTCLGLAAPGISTSACRAVLLHDGHCARCTCAAHITDGTSLPHCGRWCKCISCSALDMARCLGLCVAQQ